MVDLCGPPLCGPCELYGTECVGHCEMSDEERTEAYISRGPNPLD